MILEVNGTPNLYYHYNKKDGVCPVAVHLLRRLLVEDFESINTPDVGERVSVPEGEVSHV